MGIFSILFGVLAVVLLAYMIGKALVGLLWIGSTLHEFFTAWRMDRRETRFERRHWR